MFVLKILLSNQNLFTKDKQHLYEEKETKTYMETKVNYCNYILLFHKFLN